MSDETQTETAPRQRAASPTAFGRLIHRLNLRDTAVAEELAVTRQYVNQLARGKVTPGRALAKRIAEWAKAKGGRVAMDSWDEIE